MKLILLLLILTGFVEPNPLHGDIMKVVATKKKPTFEAVTLSITLETEAELITFHCLFSHDKLCEFLRNGGIESSSIRDELSRVSGDGFNYEDKFEELREIIQYSS